METPKDGAEVSDPIPISLLDKVRMGVGGVAMSGEAGLLVAVAAGVPIGKAFVAGGIPLVAQSIPVFLDIDQGRKG